MAYTRWDVPVEEVHSQMSWTKVPNEVWQKFNDRYLMNHISYLGSLVIAETSSFSTALCISRVKHTVVRHDALE